MKPDTAKPAHTSGKKELSAQMKPKPKPYPLLVLHVTGSYGADPFQPDQETKALIKGIVAYMTDHPDYRLAVIGGSPLLGCSLALRAWAFIQLTAPAIAERIIGMVESNNLFDALPALIEHRKESISLLLLAVDKKTFPYAQDISTGNGFAVERYELRKAKKVSKSLFVEKIKRRLSDRQRGRQPLPVFGHRLLRITDLVSTDLSYQLARTKLSYLGLVISNREEDANAAAVRLYGSQLDGRAQQLEGRAGYAALIIPVEEPEVQAEEVAQTSVTGSRKNGLSEVV